MDLFELYDLAEECNVQVYSFDLDKCESISVQRSSNECSIAINPMLLRSSVNEKVCLAHELGHCMTGSFYNKYSELDIIGKHEEIANRWAIEQLIPFKSLQEAYCNFIVEIWDLAEYFEVSEDLVKKAIEYYKIMG